MSIIRAALALIALACAEPTAVASDAASTPTDTSRTIANTFSIDRAGGTMYVRLASPRSTDVESPHEFIRRMFATADASGARRLVVDLRLISGTDARIAVPLVRGVVVRDRFARSGGLVVVTGERSFSQRQATASLLARYAAPRFVSEYEGR
jgi:hypothetical protein